MSGLQTGQVPPDGLPCDRTNEELLEVPADVPLMQFVVEEILSLTELNLRRRTGSLSELIAWKADNLEPSVRVLSFECIQLMVCIGEGSVSGHIDQEQGVVAVTAQGNVGQAINGLEAILVDIIRSRVVTIGEILFHIPFIFVQILVSGTTDGRTAGQQ